MSEYKQTNSILQTAKVPGPFRNTVGNLLKRRKYRYISGQITGQELHFIKIKLSTSATNSIAT